MKVLFDRSEKILSWNVPIRKGKHLPSLPFSEKIFFFFELCTAQKQTYITVLKAVRVFIS